MNLSNLGDGKIARGGEYIDSQLINRLINYLSRRLLFTGRKAWLLIFLRHSRNEKHNARTTSKCRRTRFTAAVNNCKLNCERTVQRIVCIHRATRRHYKLHMELKQQTSRAIRIYRRGKANIKLYKCRLARHQQCLQTDARKTSDLHVPVDSWDLESGSKRRNN